MHIHVCLATCVEVGDCFFPSTVETLGLNSVCQCGVKCIYLLSLHWPYRHLLLFWKFRGCVVLTVLYSWMCELIFHWYVQGIILKYTIVKCNVNANTVLLFNLQFVLVCHLFPKCLL